MEELGYIYRQYEDGAITYMEYLYKVLMLTPCLNGEIHMILDNDNIPTTITKN